MPPRRGRRTRSPPIVYDDYSSDSIHEFLDDDEDHSANSTTSANSSDDSDDDFGLVVRDIEAEEDLEYTLTSENGANIVRAIFDDSGHPESSDSTESSVNIPPTIDEQQPGPSTMPPAGRRRSTATTRGRGRSAVVPTETECTDGVSPAKKMKLEEYSLSPSMEENNSGCMICYDDYSQTGEHRAVCLKCGHIFGKSCIEQWVRPNKNCPTCKITAKLADIRALYGNFSTGDTNESNQLRIQNKLLQDEKIVFVSTIGRLETELLDAKRIIEELNLLHSLPPDDKTFELIIKNGYNPKLVSRLKTKTGRSFGVSPDGNFVVTSCDMMGYGSKPNGIQKISLIENANEKLQAHNEPIRCIRVCPFNSNLIASISDAGYELNIYESKQGKPLELRRSCKLDHKTWVFCWENENKLVIGARDGTLQKITLIPKLFDELVEKNNAPILDVFYNCSHEVLFVGSPKGIYAYRGGVTELVKDRVQSFYYDSNSNCFLVTIPPGDGSPTKLQLFKVKITGSEIVATKIREFITMVKTTSSTTANIFWITPTGHIVCAFNEESKHFTRLFNWGKLDDPNPLEIKPKNERTLLPKDDKESVTQYAHFTRTTPPGPLAPNGIQDVFAILTKATLHFYIMLYERSED